MKAAACVLLLTGLFPAEALQDPRPPAPDAAAQARVEKLIRDVFKDEYARTSAADRLDLAKKLLQQGIDTVDDPPSRFVLFREARDLAAQAGDLDTALAAVDEMDKSFQIRAPEMKNAVLSSLARTAKDPEVCKRLTAVFLLLIGDALASDDYETASKAAASASALARKSKDLSLASRADMKVKEVAELKAKCDAVAKAREKLATDPSDAAANLTVGRFLCLVKGAWEQGLPFLEKGSDDGLKSLAALDRKASTDAESRMSAGDGWWDLAEKETGVARENLRRRAAYWYEQCVELLSGFTRRRIETRLAEVPASRPKVKEAGEAAKGTKEAGADGWLDITNPDLFGLPGKQGDAIEVASDRGFLSGRFMTKFPQGNYDAVSARIRLGANKGNFACLGFENGTYYAGIDTGLNLFRAYNVVEGKVKLIAEAACPEQKEYVVSVAVDNGELVCFVDGKETLRFKAGLSRVTYLSLAVESGGAIFDQVRLRKKSK